MIKYGRYEGWIQLLLHNKHTNKILLSVWHYSSDADTHTVETHIYRLRKKINDKFLDEKFILNSKEGYSFWKRGIKLQ